MNLSGSILIWTLGKMPPEFYQKLENTYIGSIEWQGSEDWGDYFYVLLNSDISTNLLNLLYIHPMFVELYFSDDSEVIAIFKFTEEQKRLIVDPFIAGKYSEIDRDYVKKYFARVSPTGRLSTNWQILNKDKALKDHWEQELNVTPYIKISIPDNAEVWSKIKKENEVLGYQKYKEIEEDSLVSM